MNDQSVFDKAPDWATHHAFDGNGVGNWFNAEPIKGRNRWHTDSDTVTTMESGNDRLAPYSAWGDSLVKRAKSVKPVPPSATPEQVLGRMVENNRHGLPTFDGIEVWDGDTWHTPTVYRPNDTYRVATIVRSLNGVILPPAVTVEEMMAAKVNRGYYVANPLASGNCSSLDAAFAHAGPNKNELKLQAISQGLVYHTTEDAALHGRAMTNTKSHIKYTGDDPEAGE